MRPRPKPAPAPRHITPEQDRHMRRRTSFFCLAMAVVCFGVLLARLFVLQVLDPEGYADRAADQQLRDTVIPAARGYADGFYLAAAAQRNRNFAAAWARLRGLSFADEEILFDPQTSGGLLFALDADVADDFVREIAALGLPCGKIGQLLPRMDAAVIAEP